MGKRKVKENPKNIHSKVKNNKKKKTKGKSKIFKKQNDFELTFEKSIEKKSNSLHNINKMIVKPTQLSRYRNKKEIKKNFSECQNKNLSTNNQKNSVSKRKNIIQKLEKKKESKKTHDLLSSQEEIVTISKFTPNSSTKEKNLVQRGASQSKWYENLTYNKNSEILLAILDAGKNHINYGNKNPRSKSFWLEIKAKTKYKNILQNISFEVIKTLWNKIMEYPAKKIIEKIYEHDTDYNEKSILNFMNLIIQDIQNEEKIVAEVEKEAKKANQNILVLENGLMQPISI